MGLPAVSIITPMYNAARFLLETIDSVIAQTDFPDWELILIDDGSQDETVLIATEFCERDSRIRLFTHEGGRNLGSSASRNLGIACSDAELIALLDADDTWMPNKLRTQVDTLEGHPEAAMTYCAAQRWYSWNDSAPEAADFLVPAVIPGIGTDKLIPPPELLLAYLRDESATPCTCSVLLRREAVLRAGAFEASFPGLYDDQVFYAKICLNEPVFVSSQCLARYRQHSDSCCATARRLDTCEQGRKHFLDWLHSYTPLCLE